MEIDNAKKEVETLFKNISPMIVEIVDKYSKELDIIFKKLSKANTLTNEEIRNYILELSIESYMFGMSKDASVLKQECATTLLKEGQALSYNNTGGTQAVRTNQSIIDTTDKQVVSLIYSGVSNMMKTKLDEAHRMINALNSILISRNAEAKMSISKSDFEQEPVNNRIRLNEELNSTNNEVEEI